MSTNKQKTQKKKSSKSTIECNYCHSIGHKKAKCPVLKRKKNIVCHSCGEKGHVRNKCPHRGTMFMFLKDDFKKQATFQKRSGRSKNKKKDKVSANTFAALEEADEVRIKVVLTPAVVAAAALQGSWCQKLSV